jgi:predicted MFS family arabinose efflux permease
MPARECSGTQRLGQHDLGRGDPVTPPPAGLRQPVVWLLAAATGAIAANLYYAQPLLHLIATAFAVGNGAVGLLVTVTQIGFAVGLVLLLPLADVVNGRRLFSVLLVVNAAALAVVASAPNITVAITGFAVVGLTNVAAQVVVPVAAAMASDEQCGRVVGTVITGLLVGILVARTVSGLVSQAVGWRPLFYAAAGLMIVVIVAVRAVLPTAPGPRMRYLEVLGSLVQLYRTHDHLRVRSAYGLLGFAAFSLFWTTLAFLLTGPHYRYQVAVVGLFGLLGAAGATAATLAGRLRHPGTRCPLSPPSPSSPPPSSWCGPAGTPSPG